MRLLYERRIKATSMHKSPKQFEERLSIQRTSIWYRDAIEMMITIDVPQCEIPFFNYMIKLS